MTQEPKKGISVVAGVGKSGERDMVLQIHTYNLAEGGVTTFDRIVQLIDQGGLLWWDMDQLKLVIDEVVDMAGQDVPLSWLGPGADVAVSLGGGVTAALHYRSLQDEQIFQRITEELPASTMWKLQDKAAATWFQAVCQCYAMNELGLDPVGVAMMSDWVSSQLSGIFARSRSMAKSNGIYTTRSANLFQFLGLDEWYDSLTSARFYGMNELVTGHGGCVTLPHDRHDSVVNRLGAIESDAEGGLFEDDAPCNAAFVTGGWSMVSIRMPEGRSSRNENAECLCQIGAAQEGIGPQACWVRNSILSGLYKDVCKRAHLEYDMAADLAKWYLPWKGEHLPVSHGVMQCAGGPAIAESIIKHCGSPDAALALIIDQTATMLVDDLQMLSMASGIEVVGSVSLIGGFSVNPLFVERVRKLLEPLGLGVRLPVHRPHMTEDSGLARVISVMRGIPFREALRIVQRVRSGEPA